MMKNINQLLLISIISVLILYDVKSQKFIIEKNGKNIYHNNWIDLNKNNKKDIYEDPSQPVDARINDLLGQMNLEEKTCQMATLYGYKRVMNDELPTGKIKLLKTG